MPTYVAVVVAASLAFVGTMFDNFFAFAAQLVVTEAKRHRRVSWAHAFSVALLVVIAAAVGSVLAAVPLRLVGVLAIAPLALAVHAFRHPVTREQYRRGVVTTFALTLTLGGDNVAVWAPLLRANGVARGVATIVIFALWELLFVTSASALAKRENIVRWGTRVAPRVVPWLYLALGVVILVECHTI
ncbi:MAG: cadmium resistance transporter [Acidobacteriota bacterium]|nr:cadmium resistance transporter [Acidobacteriota bacterium]MDE3044303.1 cadmium resistance transporter [Acidobacteriota bacterium]MDE3107016.1 cadmium resistance transporter [Acidobacteriota bacterium]MDE3222013.1 cadmium resistance transporter [Acidobacteriota bacterium]